MFQSAKITGTRYCGPTALSAVSGLGTLEISRIIRDKYEHQKYVKGLYASQLQCVLTQLKIRHVKTSYDFPLTLRRWREERQRPDATYIVWVTGHFLTVKDNRIVCTQNGGVEFDFDDSKYLRCRVMATFEICSEPTIEDDLILKTRRKVDPCYAKFRSLAKRFHVDVERSETGTIWFYLPEHLIDSEFGGDDPLDNQHYGYNYQECYATLLEAVQPLIEKGYTLCANPK